ncbi:hypothetical protein PIB30_070181 [Stylosanthes scabra]|uniref:Uncharacterized protein n=1 Tax=Stylosanthes scabra TaxID=79078 RepID=A0ABU6YMU6_9FABA|nr:hypothetical protein [Stylosanthes scabra]
MQWFTCTITFSQASGVPHVQLLCGMHDILAGSHLEGSSTNGSSLHGERSRSRSRRHIISRRHITPTPPRRRNRTPEVLDDGWEQEIVGRTPFVSHILRVQFSKSFTKPTDMGYDGSTDSDGHIDAFEGKMNCECARDAMRCKAFHVSLAGQAMCLFKSLPRRSISRVVFVLGGQDTKTSTLRD